jgi:hypothetical protein
MIKKYWYLIIGLIVAIGFVPKILNATNSVCTYHSEAYRGLELTQLVRELENTGLIGEIHGAVGESQLFVLSVREVDDFFSHREFSLVARDSTTLDTLKQLKRHDRVCIQGKILNNPSPQSHIAVNSIQVIDSWSPSENLPAYSRKARIPAELSQKNNFVGKVHGISANGKILVVEYQDGVIPLFVTAPEYTQNLYRGDIVRLFYQIQPYPSQPTHLQLDTTVEKPLVVLDAIANWHDRSKILTGKLVKFPQSPQLNFDVYGIEVDTQGIKRYFTLVNFDNLDEFTNIRALLAKIWDENRATAVSGRNMLLNPKVTIEARGIVNVVSPAQANPQILLDSTEQIQQIEGTFPKTP